MSKIEFKEINYALAFYILLLSGFVLISCMPYFFSVESRVFTVPFRAIVLFSSLSVIGYDFYNNKNFKFNKRNCFFIAFWLIYLVNVYLSFNNYEFSEEFRAKEIEVYLRIIGVCFIPSLAILCINPLVLNYKLIFIIVYAILFFILLLNVIIGIEYSAHGRSSGILSTYSIDFGHLGVTLVIMSIFNYLFQLHSNKWVDVIMLLGFFLGTYILYASGTRGPLIAYISVISYMLFVKKKFKVLYLFFFILAIIVTVLIFLNLEFQDSGSSGFFARLTRTIVSGDSSGRGKIYRDAIEVFIQNPIFGGRFVAFDGTYAHNIFLDVLMSTGILGMLIFLGFFMKSILNIVNLKKAALINANVFWIYLIFIQYLIFAFFSCSLFNTPELWYLTAMIMVLDKSNVILQKTVKNV